MRRETVLRVIFWIGLTVALALALNPHPPRIPGEPSDKVEHVFAFLVLTSSALVAYPAARRVPLGLALSGFGATIEFLQMIPVLHRSSEFLDWVADTGAIIAVIMLAALLRRPGQVTLPRTA